MPLATYAGTCLKCGALVKNPVTITLPHGSLRFCARPV